MSVFQRFQLPQLLRKRKSDEKSIVNIPRFDCNALAVKEWLGQGSFGDVYTVDYEAPGKVCGCEESVAGSGPRGEETFLQRSSSS